MPEAVKEAARRADEMIQQLAAQAQGDDAPPADPPEEDAPADSPDADPPQLSVIEDDSDDGAGPDVQEQLAELNSQLQTADQRWKTLQGQIGSKDQTIEHLRDVIANMQRPPAPEPAPSEPTGVTADDITSFGQDMIDMVGRIARQIYAEQSQSLVQDVATVRDNLGQVSAVSEQTAKQTFEVRLEELFPGYTELDVDDRFIAWLQENPARLKLFQTAVQSRDAAETAGYFQLYADQTGWQSAATAKQQKAAKRDKQVAPGKTRSKAVKDSASPEQGSTWTASQIAALYRNKSKYSAKEFDRLERDQAQAQKEGRVDWNS